MRGTLNIFIDRVMYYSLFLYIAVKRYLTYLVLFIKLDLIDFLYAINPNLMWYIPHLYELKIFSVKGMIYMEKNMYY